MKKIFTLFGVACSTVLFSQSFAIYTLGSGCNAVTTLTNGAVFNVSTAASTLVTSPVHTDNNFNIKNTTATTKTITVKRTILGQYPMLLLDNGGNGPDTYFCLGNCFGSNVSVAPSTDWQTLGPVGSTVTPYDNVCQNAAKLVVTLAEGLTIGKYVIRYTAYDVNNPNDSTAFIINYNNAYAGINENGTVIESISDVFPNPAVNSANLVLNLKQESVVKVQLYSSIGSLVMNQNEQKFSPGKNKLTIDCSGLSQGIYLVQVTAGNNKITKRMLINK